MDGLKDGDNMKERIISGTIMALLLILILYIGGLLYNVAIGIISIIAFKELINVKKNLNIPRFMKIIGLLCMLGLIFLSKEKESLIFGLSYETLSLVYLSILAPTIFLTEKKYNVSSAFYLASISIFLGVIFNLFIALYNASLLQFLYCILVACMTDIFALFSGKLIGRHPLTKISPGKTIEGAFIGTLVSVAISSTFYITFIGNMNIITIIIFSTILSSVGQIGDIFFSLIKRENNVKDYSNLIPGHGGILDRLDSVIFILIAFIFMIQFL